MLVCDGIRWALFFWHRADRATGQLYCPCIMRLREGGIYTPPSARGQARNTAYTAYLRALPVISVC